MQLRSVFTNYRILPQYDKQNKYRIVKNDIHDSCLVGKHSGNFQFLWLIFRLLNYSEDLNHISQVFCFIALGKSTRKLNFLISPFRLHFVIRVWEQSLLQRAL